MLRWFALAAAMALAGAVAKAPPAAAAKRQEKQAIDEEVDYLALASILVRDGHYARAAAALQQVDENAKDLDRERYHLLRGLIAMHDKVYLTAVESFGKAIEAGAKDPVVFISLAQAHFGLNDHRGAIAALDRAGPAALDDSRAELLRSRAHWELGEAGPALAVLERAGKRFPELVDFPRNEMSYLIRLGLYQELARARERFLERGDIEAGDLAAIGEALRQSGQLPEAQRTVEAARLRFPDDVGLAVLLARVLMDAGDPLSSAMVLEDAARRDPRFLIEAAEMYRRAGRLERALFLNARVSDQKVKMRQRLQILLQLERVEMVAAMEARLSRLGLLEDEQIRYALAYGFFMIRDFAGAERHLAGLRDPDLFQKAVALRKAMASCAEQRWQCQ